MGVLNDRSLYFTSGPDAFFMPFGGYGYDGQDQGNLPIQGDSNHHAGSANHGFGYVYRFAFL